LQERAGREAILLTLPETFIKYQASKGSIECPFMLFSR
jgi:hypothetical protein